MKQPTQHLQEYIEGQILPRYDRFDAAHQRDHAQWVINEALRLGEYYNIDVDMLYTAAAFHDTGLEFGREEHHIYSAQIIRNDAFINTLFTSEQVEIIADAAEDHRASNTHEPRTIYGRLVAEADRQIIPEVCMRRTVQYGLKHYPEMSTEEHYARLREHLVEKYGRGGYLRCWIPQSDNAIHLEELRDIIDNESLLRQYFNTIFDTLRNCQ